MQRCEHCLKRKLPIISYSCKCTYTKLCGHCRFPETHDCKFDYKTDYKITLEKENPKIINSKIIII
jgi:hypothetical protein